MKKIPLFIIILLLLPFAYAQQDLYKYTELELNIDVGSSLKIIPESDSYSISKLKAELHYHPIASFRQEILDMDSDGGLEGNVWYFEWKNPKKKKYDISFSAKVRTKNNIPKIKKKIKFPVIDVPNDVKEFLEETEKIDYSDPRIVGVATKLAEGEDDLYIVVGKTAQWVREYVDYDLNTATAKAAQSASWTIDHKEGVCDEITNLFIAMLRSIGIPAKFISGVAYTTSKKFTQSWGPHGWAEVYFPGIGWIPYDVTYGEVAFIDAAHIKLKQGIDSDTPGIRYSWEGRDVEVEASALKTDVNVLSIGNIQEPLFELTTRVLKPETGIGSYNIVEVAVKNKNNYYIATEAKLSESEGLTVYGKPQVVFLEPNERKKLYWIIKVDDRLSDDYIYTFYVAGYTTLNVSSIGAFIVKKGEKVYSLGEIRDLEKQFAEEEEKTYSKDISLQCSTDKDEYYQEDEVKVNCVVKNLGNTLVNNLDVCVEECKNIDIGIGKTEELVFSLSNLEVGKKDMIVKAKNIEILKTVSLKFTVLDKPKIVIEDIIYPESVDFDKSFALSFSIDKSSVSVPLNLDISVFHKSEWGKWQMNELEQKQKFNLNIGKYSLTDIGNDIKIKASYKDKKGNPYSTEQSFVIKLNKLTIKHRIIMFFNKIGYWFKGIG